MFCIDFGDVGLFQVFNFLNFTFLETLQVLDLEQSHNQKYSLYNYFFFCLPGPYLFCIGLLCNVFCNFVLRCTIAFL